MSRQLSYLDNLPIAAVSTALGGAIAIVRVSGEASLSKLQPLLGNKKSDYAPRQFCLVEIQTSSGRKLDQAGFIYFPKETSMTGEEGCELHLHGNSYIVARVFEEILSLGFRQAQAGEFAFRAFQNGKMDLTRVEGLRDLLEASNDLATDQALKKIGGAQTKWVLSLGEKLRMLLTLAEAALDFSDQDIEEVSLPKLKRELREILRELEIASASFERGQRLVSGHSLVLVGRPNAGKSSLFNELLGEDRAIISNIPGTTRDVLREKFTVRSGNKQATFVISDTAGIRELADNADPIEAIGMQKSREAYENADVVLWILDPTQQESAEIFEVAMVGNALKDHAQKVIAVFSKSDLVSQEDLEAFRKKLEKHVSLSDLSSCVTSVQPQRKAHGGIDKLVEKLIQKAASPSEPQQTQDVWVTRIEQKHSIDDAIQRCLRALEAEEADLFASDIRSTLVSLNEILGETTPDMILERIFSQFCIGK